MKNIKIKDEKLEGNIWKLYLYMVLYSLMFFTPIIVLFYQDNGLSLTQIMIIQSISSALFVLLEVPSGYFADIFGRKKSLMITSIFATIAMIYFAIGTNFYHLLLAASLWAIAGVFISGADSALLYDTLKDLKKESSYKKIWGNVIFFYSIGVSIASIIGGLIGGLNYRYPFFAMIPFMLLLIPLSFSFEEPKKHKIIFSKNYLFDLLGVIKLSILKNKKLRWLLAYSAIVVGFIQIAYFLYQPYFKLSGLNVVYFGVVFAGFNVVVAISAKYSHVLEEKIGQKYALILLFMLVGISFLLMSNFIFFYSFVFVFLIQFVSGFSSVVISDYVNKLADSSIRATTLSVKSLIEKMFFAVVTPFIGWISDVYSLQQALALSGIIIFIFGTITLLLFWRNKFA
ncbi:MAG: MFS transporter [Candidatus Moraniibacteriota bacterium]